MSEIQQRLFFRANAKKSNEELAEELKNEQKRRKPSKRIFKPKNAPTLPDNFHYDFKDIEMEGGI